MTDSFCAGPRVRCARTAWRVVSALAWFGVVLTNIGNIFDVYPRDSGHWPGACMVILRTVWLGHGNDLLKA